VPDVFIATATVLPRPDEDDEPLRQALARRGVVAETRAWDDRDVPWGTARACVIRSTWNYVQRHEQFLLWAERCAALTRLVNSLEVVQWNVHKGYLVELAERGLPVVPTSLVRRGQSASLETLAGAAPEVVIKPAVSAGSLHTLRIVRADFAEGQRQLDELAAGRDVLVQPYFRSVEGYGERALVWIAGALTHAVRKHPRFAGDRQEVSEAMPIASDERELAERLVAFAPGPLLYARIDLARDEHGRPHLMELELIEPTLFLSRSPVALERLADAIAHVAHPGHVGG